MVINGAGKEGVGVLLTGLYKPRLEAVHIQVKHVKVGHGVQSLQQGGQLTVTVYFLNIDEIIYVQAKSTTESRPFKTTAMAQLVGLLYHLEIKVPFGWASNINNCFLWINFVVHFAIILILFIIIDVIVTRQTVL